MKKILLFVFMALMTGMPVFFWSQTLPAEGPWSVYLYSAGRLSALIGFVLILFQYIFSYGIKWIERGIGLDRFISVHKFFGIIILAIISSHPILILISESVQGNASPTGLFKLLGVFALLLVWMSAGAAILYGKIPLSYEKWRKIHGAGHFIFPIAFLHSLVMGSTVQRGIMPLFWAGLGLIYFALIAGKIWKRRSLRKNPFTVSEVSKETHDTWNIVFQGDHGDFAPGQFMKLRIMKGDKMSEAHPFTIASSPESKDLAICVKEVGDFTSQVGNIGLSDPAYIDMPYGVFSFSYHDSGKLVFIAGGIGITPFMSMLRAIYDRKLEKRVLLVWGNKKEEDIAFRDELEHMVSEMPALKVVHVLSRQEDRQGQRGRIDRDTLKKHLNDFTEGEFFICGPQPMMTGLKKILKELGVSGKRIHTERFALR